MLFFIRQGWPELRAVLQRRFWVGLATHANLEYAVEAARMLDPDMRETVALRGGGTAQDERWRTLDTPSAGGAGEVQAPSCISAVCSFRSDDDVQGLPPTPGGTLPPGRPPTLVPKSFAAFRGVALATGAFVALDDCVGGMGHSIWDHADISRVLRPPQVSPSPLPLQAPRLPQPAHPAATPRPPLPPQFRPFGPPENGAALARAADQLSKIHDAFFRAMPDEPVLFLSHAVALCTSLTPGAV